MDIGRLLTSDDGVLNTYFSHWLEEDAILSDLSIVSLTVVRLNQCHLTVQTMALKSNA